MSAYNKLFLTLLTLSFGLTAHSDPSMELQMQTARHMNWGITRFAGSHFQSCEAIMNPGEDPVAILKATWGKDPNVVPKQCTDRRTADFRYLSFGSGSISGSAGRLHLSGRKLNSFARFNCSGFAAGTLASAGFKHYKSQPSWETLVEEKKTNTTSSNLFTTQDPNTEDGTRTLDVPDDISWFSPRTNELHSIFKRNDTCFFKPWVSRRTSILPGDYLNVSYGHVVRVYQIGEDPLGLKKVKTRADCANIKKGNFDFTIAHSSSYGKDAGFTGVKIENAKNSTTAIISRLATFTRDLCYDTFDSGLGGRLPDVKVGEKKILLSTKDQVFSFRRHYGFAKSQCVMDPKPYTRGQWCLATSCFYEGRMKSVW